MTTGWSKRVDRAAARPGPPTPHPEELRGYALIYGEWSNRGLGVVQVAVQAGYLVPSGQVQAVQPILNSSRGEEYREKSREQSWTGWTTRPSAVAS